MITNILERYTAEIKCMAETLETHECKNVTERWRIGFGISTLNWQYKYAHREATRAMGQECAHIQTLLAGAFRRVMFCRKVYKKALDFSKE